MAGGCSGEQGVALLSRAAHRPWDLTCSGVGSVMGAHQAVLSLFSHALPTCRSLWAMCVPEELSEPWVLYFPLRNSIGAWQHPHPRIYSHQAGLL